MNWTTRVLVFSQLLSCVVGIIEDDDDDNSDDDGDGFHDL